MLQETTSLDQCELICPSRTGLLQGGAPFNGFLSFVCVYYYKAVIICVCFKVITVTALLYALRIGNGSFGPPDILENRIERAYGDLEMLRMYPSLEPLPPSVSNNTTKHKEKTYVNPSLRRCPTILPSTRRRLTHAR